MQDNIEEVKRSLAATINFKRQQIDHVVLEYKILTLGIEGVGLAGVEQVTVLGAAIPSAEGNP
jgi:hypothetical protein